MNDLIDIAVIEDNRMFIDGLRAWAEVKKLDGPKTYRAWKQAKARQVLS